jgi:uncharacterized membrane protein
LKRLAVAAALVGLALTVIPGPWSWDHVSDLPVYRAYGQAMMDGHLPYRDFNVEYPPLALPTFWLPALAGGGADGYRLAFGLLMALPVVVGVVLTGILAQRTGGNRVVATLAAAAVPLAVAALVRTRFDPLPVALVLGGLVLLCRDRPRWGMAVLGLGAMTKGFPLIAAPVALAWLAGAGRRRAAIDGALALAVVVACVGGLAVLASPSGAWHAVSYHLDRPVQIESAPAAAVYTLQLVGGTAPRVGHSFGSEGLTHPSADALSALSMVLLVALIAAFCFAAARSPDRRSLVLAALGAVTAFAALGKVLSPQFLIWVAPLVALALSWRLWRVAVPGVLALVLTKAEYPGRYSELAAREHGAQALVVARDSLLVLCAILALTEVLNRSAAPAPGSARWRWPARPGRPRPAPR